MEYELTKSRNLVLVVEYTFVSVKYLKSGGEIEWRQFSNQEKTHITKKLQTFLTVYKDLRQTLSSVTF